MTRARIVLLAAFLATFAAGAVTGGLAGFVRWRRAPSAAFQQVEHIILSRARDLPAGGVVVFGDSIVEQQRVESLCAASALNAGISGASMRHFAPVVPEVMRIARPARTVVALGTNDVLGPKPTPPGAFENQVDAVLAAAGPRPIVVGIATPDQERAGAVARANSVLRAAAERHGGHFVEPVSATLTVDGIHLSPEGMVEWKRRVNAACD